MEEVDCVIKKLHNADKNGVLEHNFIRHFDLSTSSFMNFVVFGQRLTIDNASFYVKFKKHCFKIDILKKIIL